MNLSILIVSSVAFILYSLALLTVGPWLYFKGTKRESPMPSLPPRPVTAPEHKKPTQPCPTCGKHDWSITPDASRWNCKACGASIIGPQPRIRS